MYYKCNTYQIVPHSQPRAYPEGRPAARPHLTGRQDVTLITGEFFNIAVKNLNVWVLNGLEELVAPV